MKKDDSKLVFIKLLAFCSIPSIIGALIEGELENILIGIPIIVLIGFCVYGYFYLWKCIIKFFWTTLGRIFGSVENGIKRFNEIEFKKYKGYYRDILEVNSPLMLGFLDDFKVTKIELIAQLLHLKNKGIIIIENGNIKRNEICKKVKLSNVDKQILNRIKDNKLIIDNYKSFLKLLKENVEKDALKTSLIKEHNKFNFGRKLKKISEKIKKSKTLNMVTAILLVIMFICTTIPITVSDFIANVGLCSIFALFFIGMLYAFAHFFYKGYNEIGITNYYIRTKKGEKINERLEGLKKYIRDFSLLSEREAKEIVLWDDYLIYSIIFEQNKKIVEEYKKYIKIN